MEFRQLKAFLTVANTSNFSHAAKILGYSQSSVSTQIQLLEQDLNVRLFERLGNHVVLTDQGQCFYSYANQILSLASKAKEAVSTTVILKGTITIGAPEAICSTYLPIVLHEFGRRHPQVKIKVKIGTYEDFFLWLKNNLIDIALFFQRKMTHPNLIIDCLLDEPIIAVVGKCHSLSGKGKVEPNDLNKETVILSEPGCSYRVILEGILSRTNVYPESVFEIGSLSALIQCAISGLGVAFLPRIVVEKELENGKLVELNWEGEEFGTVIQLAYHKDKWMSPVLISFISAIKEIIACSNHL